MPRQGPGQGHGLPVAGSQGACGYDRVVSHVKCGKVVITSSEARNVPRSSVTASGEAGCLQSPQEAGQSKDTEGHHRQERRQQASWASHRPWRPRTALNGMATARVGQEPQDPGDLFGEFVSPG